MKKDLGETTVGIEASIAAVLTYACGFITGIIFLLVEKKNEFVRFHAMQSVIVFGAIFIIQAGLAFMSFLLFLSPLVSLAGFVLWIVLMVKAFQGERFKLPIAGDLAEEKLKSLGRNNGGGSNQS